MKYLLCTLIFLKSLQGFSQSIVNIQWLQHKPDAKVDTIYYTPLKKLVWPDFKGKPEHHTNALAVTSSGFGYLATMQTRNNKTDIGITIYCYFSKQDSWVIAGGESDYALTHEQHHFDITYIVACNFIKKLKDSKFTRSNYITLLDEIYTGSRQQLKKMQDDYDSQTKNGQLKNIQAKWNDKIDKQLKTLSTD
jgi:hypothetical protein